MTYKQFLAELSKTTGWVLTNGAIRRQHNDYMQCPLTAVAEDCLNYFTAGKKLKLKREKIHEIAICADYNYNSKHKVRIDLLKACNLKEE